MVKKRLALMLVFAMITVFVAGCGQAASSAAPAEPAASSTAPAEPAASTAESAASTAEPAAEQGPLSFTFASGADGGSWFLISGLVSEIIRQKAPGSNVTVVPGSGSGNPVTVGTQKFEVGMAFSSYALMAYQGVDEYEEQEGSPFTELRQVMFLNNPNYFHMMASTSLPHNSLKEIIDNKYPLRFSPGQRGSSPDLIFSWVLAEYGVTYEDIESWGGSIDYVEYSDAVGLFSDGHIDMIVQATPIASATPLEMMTSGNTKLLPMEQQVIDSVASKHGLMAGVIPANSYDGQTEDVLSIFDSPVLFSNAAVPEETIYAMTKIICENTDFITSGYESFKDFIPEEHAATDIGVPFHPGAEKYYREMGWLA